MAPAQILTPRAMATPVARFVARNLGGTNQPSTEASSTSTTSAAAASSTTTTQQQDMGWGNRGSILNWAAIAVVLGLMLAIAGWRMATVRHKSFKGFFLPRGIDWKLPFGIRISVKPPPPPPARASLAELELQRRNRRAEERFQRRRTRGDNIGEGGQRQDGRTSVDDDDDEADRETLPGYKADASAPIYLEEWREGAVQRGEVPELDPETEDAIRASGPVVREDAEGGLARAASPETGDAGESRIMSVAEYEARSRGAQEAAGAGTAAQDIARDGDPVMTEVPLSSPTGNTPTSATALAPSQQRPAPTRVHSGQPPMYETGRQE